MQVGLCAVRRSAEIQTGLTDKIRKFHEIRGHELQATMRKIDVHHTSRTDGDGAEVFRTGENSLIVQVILLHRLFFIIRFSICLCNRKLFRKSQRTRAHPWVRPCSRGHCPINRGLLKHARGIDLQFIKGCHILALFGQTTSLTVGHLELFSHGFVARVLLNCR